MFAISELEPWVTSDVVAKYLGYTARRIRQLAAAGKIPASSVTICGRPIWRFKLSLIDKWLEEHSNVSVAKGDSAHMKTK